MATDPSWQQEEKRRRDSLARTADLLPRPAAPTVAELNDRGRGFPTRAATLPTAMPYDAGLARRAPPPNEPIPAAPRPLVSPDLEGISRDPARRRAQGLTRVVKTADGAYTDAPGAEGTVRYYDQMGTRVDAAPVQGDRNRRIGPREANRIMDRNQYDFAANPELEGAAVEQGRRSIDTLARRNAEGAARAAQMERRALPPEQRAALEATELEQEGLAARTAATNEANLFSEQIRAYDAMMDREREDIDRQTALDQYHRERMSNPETADAYLREELGGLMQLPPDEIRRIMSDPNDPMAGRLRLAIDQRIRNTTGAGQATAAQVVPTGGFRRAVTGLIPGMTQQRYKTGTGWGQPGFDPGEWGLTDAMFEEIFLDPAQDHYLETGRLGRRER